LQLWRWYDSLGNWIPTLAEQKEQESQQRELAQLQAQQERQQREIAESQTQQERQRSERLAARLRELGVDPDEL